MKVRGPAALLVVIAVAVVLAGCSVASSPSGSGGSGVPAPSPSGGGSVGPLSTAALKLRLIEAVGPIWFCDPDYYPVAREDESKLAAERFPEIRADTPTFRAIATDLGLDAAGAFSPADQLAVYREWKKLRAIQLQPAGSGWSFEVVIGTEAKPDSGSLVTGTIDAGGDVKVAKRAPAILTCPICLARGTRIDIPRGAVAVESLRVGDPIVTFDPLGRPMTGIVLAIGSTPVPVTHRVVHLVLSDGRTLDASPGHPLLDGRPLGTLRPGDVVDGTTVVAADLVPYAGGATYDVLASGPSGGYLADGIPLLSTIGR